MGITGQNPVRRHDAEPWSVDLVPPPQAGEIQIVSVDALSAALSPRLDGVNPDHVRVLFEIKSQLPPILVNRSTMQITDGMHRVAAARMRGDDTIRVRLFDGSDREAFALAVKSNIAHGLPLTHADRVAAAAEIVRLYPDWSDRAVAATAGLSATTVADIRRRTVGPGRLAETQKRVGLDGRLRPVDPGAGRERIRCMIRDWPNASLRQLARKAGVSPNTVRGIKKQMQEAESEAVPQREEPQCRPEHVVIPPTVDVVIPPTVDSVLRQLSQDPSVRFTESGRTAVRWFFARVVRPGEWKRVVDGLPTHTAFSLAEVARTCASEWESLAQILMERTRNAG